MDYAQLIIVAILIEAIWENLKMIWQDKKVNINILGVLIVAIVICILANIDIFPIVGITMAVPYVGNVLTSVIVARGANFVNDLFTKLNYKKGE